jgi:hypothetical protein
VWCWYKRIPACIKALCQAEDKLVLLVHILYKETLGHSYLFPCFSNIPRRVGRNKIKSNEPDFFISQYINVYGFSVILRILKFVAENLLTWGWSHPTCPRNKELKHSALKTKFLPPWKNIHTVMMQSISWPFCEQIHRVIPWKT